MSDDEDPLVWAHRNRRRNALRVLVVGLVRARAPIKD